MKVYRSKIIGFGSAALLCLSISALSGSSRQASSKSHRHVGVTKSVIEDVAPEFSLVETSLEGGIKKENLVTNRSRTYDAFTVSGTRLFVAERKMGKVFEIRGLPMEWRPFSDLVWVDNKTLVFDRWSQPHFGVHYAVNVKRKKLTSAAAFSDQFYLDQQRSKRNKNRSG